MKKILVIRFSSIGDIVLTSPVLRCLKQQLPGIELHVLTKKINSQLFAVNPNVDKVIEFESSLKPVIKQLKLENYDFIVDLHHNIRSLRIKLALGVPSASFPKLNFYKYLLVSFKYNKMPDLHIVDRYFEAVVKLGVTNDGHGLEFYPAKKVNFDKTSIPENFHKGYVAVVIGGKHHTKIFPAEKVIEVGKLLRQPMLLIGGPEDANRGDQIVEQLGGQAYNTCGKFSLGQSALAVKNATAVLTNDTGMMHIAAAYQKPIVSVWGNTVPEFGMYPYLPENKQFSIIFENKNLSCRPCSKIGFQKCPKGHFKCMMDLDPQKVSDAIEKLSQENAFNFQ